MLGANIDRWQARRRRPPPLRRRLPALPVHGPGYLQRPRAVPAVSRMSRDPAKPGGNGHCVRRRRWREAKNCADFAATGLCWNVLLGSRSRVRVAPGTLCKAKPRKAFWPRGGSCVSGAVSRTPFRTRFGLPHRSEASSSEDAAQPHRCVQATSPSQSPWLRITRSRVNEVRSDRDRPGPRGRPPRSGGDRADGPRRDERSE